jgi:hypothetical protein
MITVCWFAKYAALTVSDEPSSLLILEISEVSEYAGVAEIISADRSSSI